MPSADPRYQLGCFLGISETSNEVFVVSESCQVVKTRSLRRVPASHRWDREWLLRLAGTELQPNPGESDVRIRVRLNPIVDHDVPIQAPEPAPPRTRGVKLLESDFWAAGFTDGCRGCELISCGSKQSKVHNQECRRRMEQYLAESADGRRGLQNAVERRTAGAVGEIKSDESAPAADASTAAHAPDVTMDESILAPLTASDEDISMDTLDEVPDVLILSTSYDHGIGEVYSPPRVVPISVKHGFKGGWSMDRLVKDSDGHAWNFDDPAMRERARALVSKGFTLLVIGSPMCTYFSNIMNIAKLRMKPGDFERKYAHGVFHLQFMFELFDIQLQNDGHVLFEHPASASS